MATPIEQFQLRRVVQLWLALCQCAGSEWHPTLNNYKLQRHAPTCEFRIQVQREFREAKPPLHTRTMEAS